MHINSEVFTQNNYLNTSGCLGDCFENWKEVCLFADMYSYLSKSYDHGMVRKHIRMTNDRSIQWQKNAYT